MKISIPLSYSTYNSAVIGTFVTIMLIYVSAISMLSAILEGHIYKKRDFCDPRFYYDTPCQNLITTTIQCITNSSGQNFSNIKTEQFTTADAIQEDKYLVKTKWSDKIHAFREQIAESYIEPAIVKVLDPIIRRMTV